MAFTFRATVMPQNEAYENHNLCMETGKGESHSCYGGVADLIQFTAGRLEQVFGELTRVDASYARWRCRFPLSQLEAVAAILKAKKLRGSTKLTAEQLANLREGRIALKAALEKGQKTG